MTKNQLAQVEKQLENIDQIKEGILPRIAELHEKRAELEDQLSEAVLDDALGLKPSNGKIEKLQSRISEIGQKLSDAERLRDATEDKKGALRNREQELKLKVMEAEFLDLVPQVKHLADQYLKQREIIRQVVEEYNTKNTRANNLRAAIQDYRNSLKVGEQDLDDLPGVYNLHWTDQQTFISREQLRGQKPW